MYACMQGRGEERGGTLSGTVVDVDLAVALGSPLSHPWVTLGSTMDNLGSTWFTLGGMLAICMKFTITELIVKFFVCVMCGFVICLVPSCRYTTARIRELSIAPLDVDRPARSKGSGQTPPRPLKPKY